MTIEEVFEEYRDLVISSQTQKSRIMKNYKRDLIAAGMSEDEADEEVEGWGEVNWSQDDWKDYYGVDTDEEFEDAQDSDGYWNDQRGIKTCLTYTFQNHVIVTAFSAQKFSGLKNIFQKSSMTAL